MNSRVQAIDPDFFLKAGWEPPFDVASAPQYFRSAKIMVFNHIEAEWLPCDYDFLSVKKQEHLKAVLIRSFGIV